MPDSPAGSQAIIDRLRASVPTKGLDDPWIRLADAEAAVRDTRDATIKEIVELLRHWANAEFSAPDDSVLVVGLPRDTLLAAADEVARRFPNGGGDGA